MNGERLTGILEGNDGLPQVLCCFLGPVLCPFGVHR